jgi:hypothetical protein
MQPHKTCTKCGKKKHVRRFCRGKPIVRAQCNVCFMHSLRSDLTGRKIASALARKEITPVTAWGLRKRVVENKARAKLRKSKAATAQHARARAAKKAGEGTVTHALGRLMAWNTKKKQ